MAANPIRKIYIHIKLVFLLKVFHLQRLLKESLFIILLKQGFNLHKIHI